MIAKKYINIFTLKIKVYKVVFFTAATPKLTAANQTEPRVAFREQEIIRINDSRAVDVLVDQQKLTTADINWNLEALPDAVQQESQFTQNSWVVTLEPDLTERSGTKRSVGHIIPLNVWKEHEGSRSDQKVVSVRVRGDVTAGGRGFRQQTDRPVGRSEPRCSAAPSPSVCPAAAAVWTSCSCGPSAGSCSHLLEQTGSHLIRYKRWTDGTQIKPGVLWYEVSNMQR